MSCGYLVIGIILILLSKAIYELLHLEAGKNLVVVVKIVVCCFFAILLLVLFLFMWLINFIKSEIDSTDSIKSTIETTEIFHFDGIDQQASENLAADSTNNMQEDSIKNHKKPTKVKTVNTKIRANSKDRTSSSGELVNNLASTFFKSINFKTGKEMVEKAMK